MAKVLPFVPRRDTRTVEERSPDPVLKMKVSFVMQFGCQTPTPALVRALMHAMLLSGGLSQRAADTLTVEEVK